VAFGRICAIFPRNGWSGYASTVKRTGCPTLHIPRRDCETSAETCIFVRSCAIVKIVGAWNDAATGWPTSYWRSTTTPSIGAMILLVRRSVSAEGRVVVALVD